MGNFSIDFLGYVALIINLTSMSMGNVIKLRVLSAIANLIYIIYGLLIHAMPIVIGCSIAVALHSYHIYKQINKQKISKEVIKSQ